MTKTLWKRTCYPGRRALTTADAAECVLVEDDDGQLENASQTARNAAFALGRLVETLHEKGLLRADEVQHVLDLHGYEVTEDER